MSSFPLTDSVLRTLRSKLNSTPQVEAALRALLTQGELILRGEADQKFFLSSQDPGCGKTTAIATLLPEILKDKNYRQKGVIIFLPTFREIKEFIQATGLGPSDLATLTTDLGLGERQDLFLPTSAPILLTTQQMLLSRCSGRRFETVRDFWFNGSVRQLRIWDESILPAEGVTVTADELGKDSSADQSS